MSDIEEMVSTLLNENDLPTSVKRTGAENLAAIKKFIEEEEKEIREMERKEKEDRKQKSQNQQNKSETDRIQKDKTKEEIIQDNRTQESTSQQEENIEENSVLEEDIASIESEQDTTKTSEFKEKADTNQGEIVSSSVMKMILSESEANTVQIDEGSSKDIPKQEIKNTPSETASPKIVSPNDKGNSSISLSVGCKMEVKNFEGNWYAAEVAEVDYDEMEVLVRYEIDLKKTDEWVNVSSPRLRPFIGKTKPTPAVNDPGEILQDETPSTSKDKPLSKEVIVELQEEATVKAEEKPKIAFEVGERCLARWRDNRRFCATIHNDLGNGNYEIVFDDGFHWTCSIVRLHKMKADSLSVDTSFHAATAGSPSPLEAGPSAPMSPGTPAYHTHLFDPTRDYLGSKSERREKKRTLNIKEIFNIGQKKYKKQKTEETPKAVIPKPAAPKKPRILKKKLAPKVPRVILKKEVNTEIPNAVASIIGTLTKELEIKLKPIEIKPQKQRTHSPANIQQQANKKQVDNEQDDEEQANNEQTYLEAKDDFNIEVDNVELEDCVVNPNDDTLDDEEVEESKSEEDSVLEEEAKLENFEKQDANKHEEVIDKIKEAILKLEGGINEIEKLKSPQVERMGTPIKGLETHKSFNTPKLKLEIKPEDLKEALAEAAASIEIGEPSADIEDYNPEIANLENVKVPKAKRDPSKKKKGNKPQKKTNGNVDVVKSQLERMKRQIKSMRHQLRTKENVQGRKNASLPESFLFPGEWCCRWVNGQPVGRVSEIEGAPQAGQDNKPGLPRRSVQVDDDRLPPGWTKHMVRRSVGNSAGKWDVVLVSPDEHGNKRFHTRTDMRHFLEAARDAALRRHEDALMDFGVHLKISRRMGWIRNTPDGKTAGPETILPADTTWKLSPLVKRRNMNLEKRRAIKDKRALNIRKDTKRRPIKMKLKRGLHTYKSQLIDGESSSELNTEPTSNVFDQPLMPLEDGYVYVGSLKVQIIENLLRCPAEGCFKNFRTQTLLQMHIKHYHRELRTMMGATPKVLDLAYARQRVLPNKGGKKHPEKRVMKVKIKKPPRREEPKPLPAEMEVPMDISPTTSIKSEDAPLPKIPRSQDSPKLRQALIHKPVKRPRVLLPVRRPEPEPTIPESVNEEDFENQLLEPIMDIPMLEHPLDFETAISTHTVTKPMQKKKKGDKKKSFASISKNISEDEEWFAMNSDELDTRSSFPRSGSPDSKMDSKVPPMSSESTDDLKDSNLYTYSETGERIKIVHMKREEIINCHCGVREEDGLMVQCELCLCWQHALCHNIQRESEVPEKYTCSICVNPRRGRRSRRFLHDQDRLYEGLLPGARACDSLRRSHELSGNLLRIQDALHALRVKYYVATKKDHPKLYLWAKEWEQAEITFAAEKLNSDYSDLSVMINGVDKENHPSEELDSDKSSQRDSQLGSQALLSGLLSSPCGASLDLQISTLEIERLTRSVQESAEWQRLAAPQPEAAIENSACRERLLRHVQRCHALIDTRLDSIEAQVAELESQDPSFGEHYETAEYFPRTKQTIQMLMRDLDTMEELGVIT